MEADEFNKVKRYNNHPSGIECIEVVRHMNFNCGQVFKYLWRVDEKDTPLSNLKKAQYYLNDEIKRRENEQLAATQRDNTSSIQPEGKQEEAQGSSSGQLGRLLDRQQDS